MKDETSPDRGSSEVGARVCMFVYNNCANDVRVRKEAASLAQAGHEVEIVAVLDKTTVEWETTGGFSIRRVERRPVHYKILRRSRLVRRSLRLTCARTKRRFSRMRRFGVRRELGRQLGEAKTSPVRVLERIREGQPRTPSSLGSCLTTGAAAAVALPVGVPALATRLFRAVRWRVLRASPRARRIYYGGRRKLHGDGRRLVRLTRLRLRREVESRQGERRRAGGRPRPQMEKRAAQLMPRAEAAADKAFERAASLAYRGLMAFHKPLMFIDFYFRSFRLVRRERFDIFHAHDLNTLPVAAALAASTRGSLVYDAHELYTEISTLGPLERSIWRLVEGALIGRSARVVTVCQSIAEELERRYGVAEPLIVLNCPPALAKPPSRGRNRLRQHAGLDESAGPVILYQGGFAPNRGLAELVAASATFERGTLVLMGWGRLEEELRRQIEVQGLHGRVVMTGPVEQEELLSFTRGADVGVIPYRAVGLNNYYTTPNKLFEYMAAGVPVAGSGFPELRRFVHGYGFGRTFDPDFPADIARAVNEMLGDDLELGRMRKNAEQAGRLFTWESESLKLVDLYTKLHGDHRFTPPFDSVVDVQSTTTLGVNVRKGLDPTWPEVLGDPGGG